MDIRYRNNDVYNEWFNVSVLIYYFYFEFFDFSFLDFKKRRYNFILVFDIVE